MDEIEEIRGRLGKGNLFADEHVQTLLVHIATLEEKVKYFEGLSERIQLRLEDAESRLKKLQEAVDKHERLKRGTKKVVGLIDEELYQTRKGV